MCRIFRVTGSVPVDTEYLSWMTRIGIANALGSARVRAYTWGRLFISTTLTLYFISSRSILSEWLSLSTRRCLYMCIYVRVWFIPRARSAKTVMICSLCDRININFSTRIKYFYVFTPWARLSEKFFRAVHFERTVSTNNVSRRSRLACKHTYHISQTEKSKTLGESAHFIVTWICCCETTYRAELRLYFCTVTK